MEQLRTEIIYMYDVSVIKKIDLIAILKFVHYSAGITHPLACDCGAVCCCRGAGTDVGVASAWRV